MPRLRQQHQSIATKLFLTLSISLLALLTTSPLAFAEEAGSPVTLLQTVADQMIASLQKNKVTLKSNPQFVYSLAYKLVLPNVDVNEMARRVLPARTWQEAKASQRTKFEHEFVDLLVHTYASALASYTDQSVQFYPIRGGYQGKTNVEVNSQITSSSGAPPVSVRYQLTRQNGPWKIYDMSVEGISVIESFRSQFADVLAQGSIDVLIKRLAEHNTQTPEG